MKNDKHKQEGSQNKIMKLSTQYFRNVEIFRFNKICPKDHSTFSLDWLKGFGSTWEGYGPDFDKISKFQKSYKKYCNMTGDLD